jgi:transcriptional regulator with XRE-family HTH domain
VAGFSRNRWPESAGISGRIGPEYPRGQRKADGLTLAETAGLTNVGVRFLSELENGKPTVRLDKLLLVLNALGLQLHLTAPNDADQR